jgi:hypothetical protein
VGILHLPNPIHSNLGELTSPSDTVAPSLPSSVGSSIEPESNPTSILCIDYDTHHVVGPNDFTRDHDDGSTDHESCNIGSHWIHFQCAAIDPVTRVDDGNG